MIVDENFNPVLTEHNSHNLISIIASVLDEAVVNYVVCLIDRSVIEDSDKFQLYVDKVNEHNLDFIIIANDHPYYGDILSRTSLFNKPVIVLGTVVQDRSLTLLYPHWVITYPALCFIDYTTRNSSFKKSYLYSCLNYHPHDFRVANLVKFHQSSYWDKSLITFLDVINHWATAPFPFDYLNHGISGMINHYVDNGKQYFIDHLVPVLPLEYDDQTLGVSADKLMGYDNPAYLDTYVSIITESTITFSFLSEKILKSICAEQFFVVISGQGTVAYLRSLGFDTYDDIINHNHYDTQEHPKDRLRCVHELLETMKDMDWETIYKQTQDRRAMNREHLLSGKTRIDFLSKLTDTINILVQK